MEENKKNTEELLSRIFELEEQLFEMNTLVDAIKEGSVDAFVLNKEGRSDVYALQSIDYTYRILIEKFGEGALSISEEGLILYCNFYFSELLGIPNSQLIGSYFQEHVSSVDDFTKLIEQLKTGPSKGELVLVTKNDRTPVYISLSSLQPYLPAVGIIVTDLTLKKKHEREIEEYQNRLERKINELNITNNDLEQFVHIISHDIKEPLRKIVSYGERLHKELSSGLSTAGLKNLKIIYDATLRLNVLVDDLVRYSFATQNKVDLSEIDLMKTLRDVLEDSELLIQEKKAIVSFDNLPKVRSTEVQMRQLFSNIIINAIKYSRKGVAPLIDISSQKTDIDHQSFFKVTISDNGIGMEQQYLQKIFTIFQRLHTPAEYSGTGIGLAICKKIMENNGGKIEVESVLNQGSRFLLYLPVP